MLLFSRCRFIDCAFRGTVFDRTILRDCEATECTFAYAALSDTDVKRCTLRRCDFTESRFDNANLAKTAFEDCRMTATEFFLTSLAGIDLSSCLLAGIRTSSGAPELCGAIVDRFQASELARILGVEIKD